MEEASKKSENGQFTISNTTNLTLRLFKDGYLPSVPVTRSYIKTSNQYTLPIISIVGDQKYFTDPKIGFDCDGDGTNGAVAGYTGGQKKNYAQDWDRPVNFSYISPDGKMLYNQDVNIKVSGGYTRTQTYRSFKLKVRTASTIRSSRRSPLRATRRCSYATAATTCGVTTHVSLTLP